MSHDRPLIRVAENGRIGIAATHRKIPGVAAAGLLVAAAAVPVHASLPPEQAGSLIEPRPVTIHAADLPIALTAAQLDKRAKRFGLGDRFCTALAERENQPVLTAGPAWLQAGQLIGLEIRLIR